MSIRYASGMTGRGSRRVLALNTARFYSTKLVRNLGATAAVADNTPAVAKIGGKAAWQKQDLLDAKWWGYELDSECLAELDNAVQSSKSANLEWDNDIPLNVSQGNFPLSKMADTIAEMSDELENGMGAAMIANIPVDKYSLEELSVMYLGICSYIGNVVQQSSAGLRSKSRGYGMPLGHVKAEMRGKTPLDGKQSNNYFRLHTDRCARAQGGKGRGVRGGRYERLTRAPHARAARAHPPAGRGGLAQPPFLAGGVG